MWALSVYIYDQNFNKRFESYAPFRLRTEDFDGLEQTKYQFASDKGQMLTGYLYSHNNEPNGIIILAHGFGGGGHNSYMDVADYFARNGFLVFTYDATGCDESEGKGVGSPFGARACRNLQKRICRLSHLACGGWDGLSSEKRR